MLGISELVVDGLKEVALVTVLTEEAAEVEATETFCNDLIKSSRRFSASLVGAAGASLGLMGSTRVAVATASEVSVAGAAGVAVVVVFVDVFLFDDDSNLASASLFFRSRSFSRRTCD